MPSRGPSRRHVLRTALAAPLALALSACGRSVPQTAAVSMTSATAATATPSPVPTATATPTEVATPTATATATPTAAPTAASTATATAAPTAMPAPTSTPNPQAVADALSAKFPGRGWDFRLRPLLFQVDNAPAARPQSGLSSAYVVYETPAEGDITRFSAVIVQQTLATIGNLRSARLVDLELAPQWDAVLVHVGASTAVEQMLASAGVNGLDFVAPSTIGAWWRTAERIAPYNLYSSLDRLWPFLKAIEASAEELKPRAFPVGPLPASAQTVAAARITLPYIQPSNAFYTWNDSAAGYQRFNSGTPLIDANTGHQIVVSNVVVHYATETVTDIIEDVEGSHSLKFQLQGSGQALLWRDGKRVEVTWQRTGLGTLTQYRLPDGTPVPFAPGNVWIAIVSDTLRTG